MPEKHYLERELEDLIRTNSEAWSFVQKSSLDGVWYWDLVDTNHEWMSPEFWQLLGIDPDEKEHLSSEWQDLIHPEDLELCVSNFLKHCEDERHPYDQIVRYRHAEGHTVWVRCRGIAIRDETGKPIRLLGSHHDLTALKTVEEDLRQANARLRIEIEAAANGIIGLTSGCIIASANPAARALLGLEEKLPQPWPERITFKRSERCESLEPAENPIGRALSGERLKGEICIMSPGSGRSDLYVRISTVPIDEPGSEVASVVVIEDVTEQELGRQRIERSNRLDALGQLTAVSPMISTTCWQPCAIPWNSRSRPAHPNLRAPT